MFRSSFHYCSIIPPATNNAFLTWPLTWPLASLFFSLFICHCLFQLQPIADFSLGMDGIDGPGKACTRPSRQRLWIFFKSYFLSFFWRCHFKIVWKLNQNNSQCYLHQFLLLDGKSIKSPSCKCWIFVLVCIHFHIYCFKLHCALLKLKLIEFITTTNWLKVWFFSMHNIFFCSNCQSCKKMMVYFE